MRTTRIIKFFFMVLLIVLLNLNVAVARRAVGAKTKVWITDGRYTLAELAQAVANPNLMRYEGGVATIYGAFELAGKNAELVINPGETLRMRHIPVPPGKQPPPQQILDRRMFLTKGRVTWKNCTVEGFYWISVNPSVAGVWENVKFRVADDHDSVYEPIEFGSSYLKWRGGEVDARVCSKLLLPSAPWAKFDVETTIENTRFLSGGMILGPLPVVNITGDYTFRNCVFDSPFLRKGNPRRPFHIESHASDLGVFHVKLIDPVFVGRSQGSSLREDTIAQVRGSTAQVVFVREGKETVLKEVSPDLHSVKGSDSFERIYKEAAALRAQFNRPDFAKDTGSLFWPFERLWKVQCGLAFANSAKRYSDGDMKQWSALTREVKGVLNALPDLWRPGSRFHPKPVPFPVRRAAATDTASVQRRSDGAVEFHTRGSHLIYNPHGDAIRIAAFTAESRILGRPLMDTYPRCGAISIRVTGKNTTPSLDCHFDWKTRVTKPEGTVLAGMEAWTPGGASATILCFRDLPELILFDVNSNYVRYQAYAKGNGHRYNGLRMWNKDLIERTFNPDKFISIADPERGVFVASLAGEWYKTKLVRGFVPAQWNGFNDWKTSPPCGCIIRADELDTTWTSWSPGGYFSYIVQVNTHHGKGHPNLDDWRETSQMLYVEGKGLGCWENIEALDRAWNQPMELQPILLEPGKKCAVTVRDTAGLERPVEIVLLPRWCGEMESKQDVYRGAHTALVLRNIAPNAKVTVGRLPLELKKVTNKEWKILNRGKTAIPNVHVRLPADRVSKVKVTVAGVPTKSTITPDGAIETILAVSPGATALVVENP